MRTRRNGHHAGGVQAIYHLDGWRFVTGGEGGNFIRELEAEDETKAARLAAILCLAGLVNLPIVHFSVVWWSTLHQPASVFRPGGSAVDPAMLGPLFTMVGAYFALFVALLLASMRTLIFKRRVEASAMRKARAA